MRRWINGISGRFVVAMFLWWILWSIELVYIYIIISVHRKSLEVQEDKRGNAGGLRWIRDGVSSI